MAEVNLDDLKGNSRYTHQEPDEEDTRERLSKVGTGRTARIKKSLRKRFIETFLADDVSKQDIRDYIIKDVIVPSIQDAIMDGINGALGMMFGIGIVRSSRIKPSSGSSGGKIKYGGYFNSGNSNNVKPSKEVRRGPSSNFEAQMKDNKGEAIKIMEDLEAQLEQAEEVSIADYYDLFGVSTVHTDNKFGWTSLDGMHLERVPRAFYDDDSRRYIDGWAVIMPPDKAL